MRVFFLSIILELEILELTAGAVSKQGNPTDGNDENEI